MGQNDSNFVIPYDCSKQKLYNKIKLIKRNIYQKAKGSDMLARVFVNSTKNFHDNRLLDLELLKSKM